MFIYFLLFCSGKLKQTKLQTCNLQTGQSISYKYINQFWSNLPHPNSNKHPKFDDNFDIWRQLEHFKYEMNQTLGKIDLLVHFLISMTTQKVAPKLQNSLIIPSSV